MQIEYEKKRQYLSTESFQGERRLMFLYGGSKRSHVTTVDRAVKCPTFADFETLPAISATRITP